MLGRVSAIHLHQLTHQRTKRYHFKKWSYVLQISAQIFDHLFKKQRCQKFLYWMLILFLVFNVLNTGVSEFGILFFCFAYELKEI